MKKYKIIKEDRVTEKEIDKYKSFTQLTQTYQRHTRLSRVPIYKNKWTFIAIVIIVLLTLWLSGEL